MTGEHGVALATKQSDKKWYLLNRHFDAADSQII